MGGAALIGWQQGIAGLTNDIGDARLPVEAPEITKHLKANPERPLHFAIEGDPAHEFIPCWEVADRPFTCFPILSHSGAWATQHVASGDLALASRGATAAADGEAEGEKGSASKVIDGIIPAPGDYEGKSWRSAYTPHPHWIEVKLPKPQKIGRVVVHFADPSGFPVSFQGLVRTQGKSRVIFDVEGYDNWRDYQINIKPVVTDTFRFIIRASANTSSSAPEMINVNPNLARVGEIELCPPGR